MSKSISTKQIIQIGMCAAILGVLSQISIPLPSGVPVTLQTFGVALVACLFEEKYGTISTCVYVLLGMIGVPIFSNFRAGVSVLFGKTGGFILGFIFMTFLCGLGYRFYLSQTAKKKPVIAILSFSILSLAGLIVCHLLGIIQFMILTGMTFYAAAILVSFPYLLKDILSIVFAFFVSRAIKRALHK